MSVKARAALVTGLGLAMILTLIGGDVLRQWLEEGFSAPAIKHLLSVALGGVIHFNNPALPSTIHLLAGTLTEMCMSAVWLMPLCFFPKLREIGSFRFPWTWTVLLGLPMIAFNLVYFGRPPIVIHEVPVALPWSIPVLLVWGAMATGLFEELVFRGYGFLNAPQAHPRWAIFISATAFALMHFVNLFHDSWLSVLHDLPCVFAMGLAYGIIRMVSGSVAWCMLLHGVTDATSDLGRPGDYFLWSMGGVGIACVATLLFHPKLRGGALAPEAEVGIKVF